MYFYKVLDRTTVVRVGCEVREEDHLLHSCQASGERTRNEVEGTSLAVTCTSHRHRHSERDCTARLEIGIAGGQRLAVGGFGRSIRGKVIDEASISGAITVGAAVSVQALELSRYECRRNLIEMRLAIATSSSREGSVRRRVGGESLGRAEKDESATAAAESSNELSKHRFYILFGSFPKLVVENLREW